MRDLMTKIFNVNVYGLKESLIASGYPMIATEIGEMFDKETGVQITDKDMHRGIKLGTVPSGTGHDNFLKGIVVQFDITYPVYWSPQFQRYHFADIVSSTSAMHRIHKIDLDECTNKYVSKTNNERLAKWIKVYNEMIEKKVDRVEIVVSDEDDFNIIEYSFEEFGCNPDLIMGEYTVKRTKYQVYMIILSNAPQGLMKTMRVTTSYLQLKTIYAQRKSHKLKEDWGYFCDWCTTLPYFSEFCINGFATKTIVEYIDIIKNRLHDRELEPVNRYGHPEAGIGDYTSYLEIVAHKFRNKLNGPTDIELRVLYVKDETPKQIECFQTIDKFGKTFVLVYPADIKMKKPLDLKLEIIENATTRIGVNYNFDDVYLTKEVK